MSIGEREGSGRVVAVSLLFVAGCAEAPGSSTEPAVEPPPSRYALRHVEDGLDPTTVPDPLAVDYDDDGLPDTVTLEGTTQITVTLTGGGPPFTYRPERPDGEVRQIRDIEVVSLREDGRFPSLVLAEMSWGTENLPAALPQHVLLNEEGSWSTVALDQTLIGRAVSCRWFEPRRETMCFYASYGPFEGDFLEGRSRLVGLGPAGQAADRTAEFGLPFPVDFDGFGTDGYHMIGSAWTDFDRDGIPDIVGVGQHSRTLLARMSADEAEVRWFGQSDDALRVWGSRAHDIPCVYVAIEPGESVFDTDFVRCHDAAEDRWYKLDVEDGGAFAMRYDRVVFWDQDGDPSTVELAARRSADETLALFQLAPVATEP
ncbi:MAG: hypothetical protein AAF602_18470 [Myxococcota bacterium]